MDPFDRHLTWLYAAEMTALLRHAVHIGGRRRHLEALIAARHFTDLLYAGDLSEPAMVRATERLEAEFAKPWGFYDDDGSLVGNRSARRLAGQAMEAYHRLLAGLADQDEDRAA